MASRDTVFFDAETLRIMGEAFDAACAGFSGLSKNDLETVADRIIVAARNGERDLSRLRDAGRKFVPVLGKRGNGQMQPFACPHCGARYKVVHVEAGTSMDYSEVTCLSCGGPLPAREGAFLMKYFRVEPPRRRQRRTR